MTQEQQAKLGYSGSCGDGLNGVNTELKFTVTALAGIYLGKIRMWSDPEIADANPNA
ncbi:hypothetical protein HDF11_002937 [Tunturiibacter psychrotolerans]|jgi:hypothetical protein